MATATAMGTGTDKGNSYPPFPAATYLAFELNLFLLDTNEHQRPHAPGGREQSEPADTSTIMGTGTSTSTSTGSDHGDSCPHFPTAAHLAFELKRFILDTNEHERPHAPGGGEQSETADTSTIMGTGTGTDHGDSYPHFPAAAYLAFELKSFILDTNEHQRPHASGGGEQSETADTSTIMGTGTGTDHGDSYPPFPAAAHLAFELKRFILDTNEHQRPHASGGGEQSETADTSTIMGTGTGTDHGDSYPPFPAAAHLAFELKRFILNTNEHVRQHAPGVGERSETARSPRSTSSTSNRGTSRSPFAAAAYLSFELK